MDFELRARSPAGDLRAVRWFVDGTLVNVTRGIAGGSGSLSVAREFTDPGNHSVRGVVVDERGRRDVVAWDVIVFESAERESADTTEDGRSAENGTATSNESSQTGQSTASALTFAPSSERRVGVGGALANTAPSASRASPDQSISLNPGETVTFSIDASDPDGDLSGSEWYLDGVHQTSQWSIGGSSDTATWSHTFDSTGSYTVEGMVFDTNSAYSSGVQWSVDVEYNAPTASRASPSGSVTVEAGQSITFKADASDTDGDLDGSEWYVDGTHKQSQWSISGWTDTATWSHTFDSAGSYTVETKVFDTRDAYSGPVSWSVSVESTNSAPSASRASPSGSVTVEAGQAVTFTADASDPDGNLDGSAWYIDGAHQQSQWSIGGSSDTATWSHTFDSTGTHTVEGEVFDTNDAYSGSVSWSVTVESGNDAPTASRASPSQSISILAGDSITFEADASDPDGNLDGSAWYIDGTHQQSQWSIDGSSGTATWSHTFDSTGTHTVEGEVFDTNDAYSGSVSWSVSVEANDAPAASRSSPSGSVTIHPNQSVTFEMDASDPDGNLEGSEWYVDGTHQQSQWSLSGSSGTTTWSHTFDSTGTYTVESKAFDAESAYSGPVSWSVSVESTNSAPSASRASPSGSVTIEAGQSITFEAAASDPDANLEGSEWYLDGAYQTSQWSIGGSSDTATWSHTFDSTGTYTVEGEVFDTNSSYSGPVNWSVAVESANDPPTASRVAPAQSVSVQSGDSITFEMDASDSDGNLEGSEWYVDGTHQQSKWSLSGSSGTTTWSHTFDSTGTYTVETKAFDTNSSYSGAVDWSVTVEANDAPSASRARPSESISVQPGESITFEADASDPDGNLEGSEWYVDGTHQRSKWSISGSSGVARWSHAFDTTGTYTVETKVFDEESAYSGAVSWSVTVESDNSAPSASRVSPSGSITVRPGESITFEADASDVDGNLEGTEWYVDGAHQQSQWSLSGSSGTTTWSHTFDSTGTHTVEGAVFDTNSSYSDPVSWTVSVESASSAPSASRASPAESVTVRPGESVTFEVDASDPDGNLEGSEWYVDGTHQQSQWMLNGSSGTASWNHTFDSTGTYTVETTVFDSNETYSGTVNWTVTVSQRTVPSFRGRAVYVWGYASTLVTDADAASRFFDRADSFGLDTVFLSWGAFESVPAADRAAFLRAAHERDLQVHALIGTAGSDAPAAAERTIPEVLAYNDGRPSAARFDGIHLDVEPASADLSTFLEDYQSVLDGVRTGPSYDGATIDSQNLVLSSAVGWWWATSDQAPTETRRLVEHPALDYVVVMAYYDTTAAVRDRLATVVTDATTPYVLAVETQEFPEGSSPESVSFYEEGRTAAEAALDDIGRSPPAEGYLGGAFHFYQSSVSKWGAIRTAEPSETALSPGRNVTFDVGLAFDDNFPTSNHGSNLAVRFDGPADYSVETRVAPAGNQVANARVEWTVPPTAPNGTYDATVVLNDTTVEGSDRGAIGTRESPVTLDTLDAGTVTVSETARDLAAQFEYAPGDPRAGDAITFNASGSTGPVESYQWAFEGGATAAGPIATHVYGDAGVYNVTLTVTGPDGGTDAVTRAVSIAPAAEGTNATFSVSPDSVAVGESVAFDASNATGRIDTYEWTFGDGATATGRRATHEYGSAGSYEVVLTVTDTAGNTSRARRTITVEPADDAGPVIQSVTPAVGGAAMEGIKFSNTFTARVNASAPIERVIFEAGEQRYVDTDGSDGWRRDVRVGMLEDDTILNVTAVDANGGIDSYTATISVVGVPDWLEALADAGRVDVDDETGVITVSRQMPQPPVDASVQVPSAVPVVGGPQEFGVSSRFGVTYDMPDRTATVMGEGTLHATLFQRSADGTLGASGTVDTQSWNVTGGKAYVSVKIEAVGTSYGVHVAGFSPQFDLSLSPKARLEVFFDNAPSGLEVTRGTIEPGAEAAGTLQVDTGVASLTGSLTGDLTGHVAVPKPYEPGGTVSLSGAVSVDAMGLTNEFSVLDVSRGFGSQAGGSQAVFTIEDGNVSGSGWTTQSKYGSVPETGQGAGASTASTGSGLTIGSARNVLADSRLTRDRLADRSPDVAYDAARDAYLAAWSRQGADDTVEEGREIVLARTAGSGWSEPTRLTDNRRLDMSPVVVTQPNGRAVAVWTQVDAVLPESDLSTPAERYNRTEIVYAVRPDGDSAWSAPRQVTNNSVADISPRLVHDAESGTWLLSWERDADGRIGSAGDRRILLAPTSDGLLGSEGAFDDRTSLTGTGAALSSRGPGDAPFTLASLQPTSDAATNGTVVLRTVAVDGTTTVRRELPTTYFKDVSVGGSSLVWVDGPTSSPSLRYLSKPAADVESLPLGNVSAVRDVTLDRRGNTTVLTYRGRTDASVRKSVYYRVRRNGSWLRDGRLTETAATDLSYWQVSAALNDDASRFRSVFLGRNFTREEKNDLFSVTHDLRPDLAVTASAGDAGLGEPASIGYTITNTGDVNVAESFTVAVRADGRTVDTRTVRGLAAGESVSGTASAPVPQTGTVSVRASTDAAVTELSTANNVDTVQVVKPNLSVADVSAVRNGSDATVSVDIRNRGSAVEVPVGYRLRAGNETLVTGQVPSVRAGDAITVSRTVPADAVTAARPVTAVVDPADSVTEADETDNARRERLLTPDLFVRNQTVEFVRQGGNVSVRVLVGNRGGSPTPVTVTVDPATGPSVAAQARIDGASRENMSVFETVPVSMPSLEANESVTIVVASPYESRSIDNGIESLVRLSRPSVRPLPGQSMPPANLDSDPLLEDVDGDGEGTLFDALTYYNERESDVIQGNPGRFDFDGDGSAGSLFDALALYNELVVA